MNAIIDKLNDGGPFFTYPMVVMLIIIIALFIRGLIKKGLNQKTVSLLISFGWFTVAWAFLGHTIGLITAFEYVAGGLKIALLNLLMGAVLFLVARLSVIILIWVQKRA